MTTETATQTGGDDTDYPISADPSKYVTLPVQHERIWRMYQTTLDWFWTVYDVYFANEREIMDKIYTEEQKHYILQIIAFMFTSHHTTINKELFMQLMNQIEIKEAVYYLGSQADAKKTHSMMYSMLLDELLQNDTKKKGDIIKEVVGMKQVREFLRWSIQSTTSSTKTFAQRLLAFATLQGIVFTVPFVLFNWTQKNSNTSIPGLSQSNNLIWRDEKLNLNFSCMLFEYLDNAISEKEAYEIIDQAVHHAKSLFTKSLPVSRLGLECDLMSQFIEYSADRILVDLKMNRLYNKEIPFDWVEEPETELYQSKVPMNSVVDMSASFGEAKFSTELDF